MKIDTQTYQARRERLMQSLPENSVVVIHTGELATRNNDCEYEFRPHSSFFYLTGFPEPSAYAIIGSGGDMTLITLPKDPEKEQWEGFRFGTEGAIKSFGASNAVDLNQLDDVAMAALNGTTNIAYLFDDSVLREKIAGWRDALAARARAGAIAPTQFTNVNPFIAEMRLFKDAEEIAIMEAAAQISVEAHKQAMRSVRPGMKEYQLEAELGAELGCYAADITRTFPANGKFSEPQAALYQVVLDAYHAGMKQLTVGTPYEACHNAAVRVLTEGLVTHGLLSGDVDLLIESKAYRDFYMHNTGHWLGLDVHDCGVYKVSGESRLLKEGMVLTIEPGLYVSADNETVDKKWRGIGIRIEDDVLIRAEGPYVLTHGLAKEIADIEALMAEGR